KDEDELPKKDKGLLLRSPKKGKKGAYIRSPSKKGVQGQSSADKGTKKGIKKAERISKAKRAKTSQKPTRKEDTSTREKFEKVIKAGSARQQERKVNEDPIEVKGLIMTSLQSLRAHLDVLKVQGPKMSKLENWFIKRKKENETQGPEV
ncbi:hypothetical protein Tco_0197768, partial [Tanacetum coccineum]